MQLFFLEAAISMLSIHVYDLVPPPNPLIHVNKTDNNTGNFVPYF